MLYSLAYYFAIQLKLADNDENNIFHMLSIWFYDTETYYLKSHVIWLLWNQIRMLNLKNIYYRLLKTNLK